MPLNVVVAFTLLCVSERAPILHLIPSLIDQYSSFGQQQSIHNADVCFYYLREVFVVSRISFFVCC